MTSLFCGIQSVGNYFCHHHVRFLDDHFGQMASSLTHSHAEISKQYISCAVRVGYLPLFRRRYATLIVLTIFISQPRTVGLTYDSEHNSAY
jgi:hypothetical protein